MSAKYRESRKEIENALPEVVFHNADNKFYEVVKPLFDKRAIYIKQLFSNLVTDHGKQNFLEILPSYIHMSLNRLFLAKPRMHELVIYDFLLRAYTSMNNMRKK